MLPGIHSLIENLAIPYFVSSLHSCPSSTFSSVLAYAVPSSVAEVSSLFLFCTFSIFLILRIKYSANITKKKGKQKGRCKKDSMRPDRAISLKSTGASTLDWNHYKWVVLSPIKKRK